VALEIVWIFLIFYLFAGSPPPDVGESHYLVKAKHYWQSQWCAGDLFCESRDAHTAFCWTFGWITRLGSLTATAWIGRALTWGLLAWSWRRLSWAVVPRPLYSLLSAGLLLLFLRNFHLAGEWVVGGVEAKGFAYVLVFLALEAIVRGRWSAALLLAGAAGAFHVLVGGWTVIAICLAWLMAGKDRPQAGALIPAAVGGFVLALPGLIPAVLLNQGAPKEVVSDAARLYVFERLSHHLVYHRFRPEYVWRFAVLLAAWWALVIALRKEANLQRLQLVVAGAVLIGLAGVALDQGLSIRANWIGQSADQYELLAASLLRFYWFRMSDSLVPVGAALAIVAGIERLRVSRPATANGLLVTAILIAALNIADVCYWRAQQREPGAILQPRPTADSWPRWWLAPPHVLAPGATPVAQWRRDWQAACAWIAANTPQNARFITPREQQTFKWYAGRAEVANWKDVPQDAAGVARWKQALNLLYPRDERHRREDLAAESDENLAMLGRYFQAQYIVIDRTRSSRAIRLPLVYPQFPEDNPSFEVYRVPELKTP